MKTYVLEVQSRMHHDWEEVISFQDVSRRQFVKHCNHLERIDAGNMQLIGGDTGQGNAQFRVRAA